MSDTNSSDYFSNHVRVRQFPWSLYHRPLEDSLTDFLTSVAEEKSVPSVLVIGCGLLQELSFMPKNIRLTVVDIDSRVIDLVRTFKDTRIESTSVVEPEIAPLRVGTGFDAIYAKEVIEHIVDFQPYLAGLHKMLRPNGRLWLSTPNYGDRWLPIIESTFLEWTARRSGYSRRDIHPTRFSTERLSSALSEAGFGQIEVKKTTGKLALIATATA